jgi:hypothetical protein
MVLILMSLYRLHDEVYGSIIAHEDKISLIGCLNLDFLVRLVADCIYIHQGPPHFISITIIGFAKYFFKVFLVFLKEPTRSDLGPHGTGLSGYEASPGRLELQVV